MVAFTLPQAVTGGIEVYQTESLLTTIWTSTVNVATFYCDLL